MKIRNGIDIYERKFDARLVAPLILIFWVPATIMLIAVLTDWYATKYYCNIILGDRWYIMLPIFLFMTSSYIWGTREIIIAYFWKQ